MQNRPGSIDRVPLNTFAIALGLTGVASTWSAVTAAAAIPPQIAQVFWALSAVSTIWLVSIHAVRGRRSGKPLRAQLRDPVQGPLAVIVPLVGMLIGADVASWLPAVGATIAIASMITTAGYSGWLVSTWMTGRIELGALHGGYILPTVAGGFITASTADALGLHGLGWAAFGVGCLFWMIMTALLIMRMASRPPLPDALVPTLAVIMAPPAVGGLALFALTDQVASPPSFAAVATYAIVWLDVAHTPSAGVLAIILGLGVTLFVAAIGIRSLVSHPAIREYACTCICLFPCTRTKESDPLLPKGTSVSTPVIDRTAPTEHPVLDVLAGRWSPRAFDAQNSIDEAKLATALEAARWSPSASNSQPWRFIVARRGTALHAQVVDALMGFNQAWAGNAAVLVVAVAETTDASGTPITHALYDLGQAVAHFSVQAHHDGLLVHQMSGFDPEVVREFADLEPRFVPFTVFAVGEFGDIEALPEVLQEREVAPRVRRPIAETVILSA
jgi:nitroreductase/tellurite resistance protein TehA-like permease